MPLVGYHSSKLSRSPLVESASACRSSTTACSMLSRPSLARLLHGCPIRSLFDRIALDATYLRGTPSHSRHSFQMERFETESEQVFMEGRPWHMPKFCLSWDVRCDISEYVNFFLIRQPNPRSRSGILLQALPPRPHVLASCMCLPTPTHQGHFDLQTVFLDSWPIVRIVAVCRGEETPR